ncbi:hypothetical protein Ahy_B03g066780 [Arachis hypogaea]|uniref:Protein Mpv17 n=1 Tax=Arachis hypogaea TaxID=3818 RepID=A0A445A4Z8_ARAHY|nr:hypothetical protein Ahy_B03g066780 [Arachis hypogaea]
MDALGALGVGIAGYGTGTRYRGNRGRLNGVVFGPIPVQPAARAVTAASLALAGDTIAQIRDRWSKAKAVNKHSNDPQDALSQISDHDWLRALRMTSYGFLLYGPGSYAWYQWLDRLLPKPSIQNIVLKVLLNQIILGPCVIAVVFAWNNLWLGKVKELPQKYQRDALPTLLYGFRFWIPGGASSSTSSFHVNGLNILEFLLVINHDQIDQSLTDLGDDRKG